MGAARAVVMCGLHFEALMHVFLKTVLWVPSIIIISINSNTVAFKTKPVEHTLPGKVDAFQSEEH